MNKSEQNKRDIKQIHASAWRRVAQAYDAIRQAEKTRAEALQAHDQAVEELRASHRLGNDIFDADEPSP
jgi:hypothetical protein